MSVNITQGLRLYLTLETIILEFSREILEAQSDGWIEKLYEFLNGKPSLRLRLENVRQIRLENGTHVLPHLDRHAQAFPPNQVAAELPVVPGAACVSEMSLEFLCPRGLTQPDPVNVDVRNVFPRYRVDDVLSEAGYEAGIGRILYAFGTDSKGQREKLETLPRESAFVMIVDSGARSKIISKLGKVHLVMEGLKELCDGVDGVPLVDGDYAVLAGNSIRELLKACIAARPLRMVSAVSHLLWERRTEIRHNAGLKLSPWEQPITAAAPHGFHELWSKLPKVVPVERHRKMALLRETFTVVESRRGPECS